MKKVFFGTMLLALVVVRSCFNHGPGRYKREHWSTATRRVCGTSASDCVA